jgi:hypothetical protein
MAALARFLLCSSSGCETPAGPYSGAFPRENGENTNPPRLLRTTDRLLKRILKCVLGVRQPKAAQRKAYQLFFSSAAFRFGFGGGLRSYWAVYPCSRTPNARQRFAACSFASLTFHFSIFIFGRLQLQT